MTNFKTQAALAASALVLAFAAPATAQVVQGGSSGSVEGEDVNAGTSGYGSTDGTSITTGGTADAGATNGGTADTRVKSNTNDRRGMTNATATARDDDERARSRTRTVVRNGEVVRSRTMSMYKQKGERPVREVESTRADTSGTQTKKSGSKPQ